MLTLLTYSQAAGPDPDFEQPSTTGMYLMQMYNLFFSFLLYSIR